MEWASGRLVGDCGAESVLIALSDTPHEIVHAWMPLEDALGPGAIHGLDDRFLRS
jgi:hypothetical protein